MQDIYQQHKKLVLSVLVILLVATGLVLLFSGKNEQPEQDSTPSEAINAGTDNSDTANVEEDSLPPTKQTTEEETPVETEAIPQISSWSIEDKQLSVRGLVDNVIENGGSCEYLLFDQSGNQIDKQTSTGVADATTTNCPPVTFSVDGLSKTAQVQLNYSSSTQNVEGVKVEVSF